MTIIRDLPLFEKYGFKLLPYFLAKSETAALKYARKIGYPIALKVVSPDIEHKSDIGGVKINIRNGDSLSIAYQDIVDNAKGKRIDGIMVQKMARRGVEVIVGGKKDLQFGHVVIIGLGGVYVEIFKDVSARICPVTAKDVEEMIGELRSHPLLEGARGKKPINKKVLESLVLKVCKMMINEDIREMDINPIIVDENGCDIVDVRVVR